MSPWSPTFSWSWFWYHAFATSLTGELCITLQFTNIHTTPPVTEASSDMLIHAAPITTLVRFCLDKWIIYAATNCCAVSNGFANLTANSFESKWFANTPESSWSGSCRGGFTRPLIILRWNQFRYQFVCEMCCVCVVPQIFGRLSDLSAIASVLLHGTTTCLCVHFV